MASSDSRYLEEYSTIMLTVLNHPAILFSMKILKNKTMILIILITITLMVHFYELLWQGLLGHSHFMHVVHGRLCYIPIVFGAFWFGLRGGILSAAIISAFSVLYIILKQTGEPHDLIGEYTEIVFYFAIAGFSGFLIDRERKERKKKEQAEQKLHQTERLSMMGHMAASIAHEIKNPLGSIKGAAQILKDGTTSDEDKAEFAAIIEKESDRLDGVVHDFLAYSRPAPSHISDISISDILDTAQKHLRFQGKKQGIEITFKTTRTSTMRGDSDKLHRAFLNVLLNAIQAMPDGGKIEMNCQEVHEESGEFIMIQITDNGPGISPDILPNIFDPFFSTKSHGTGLGLATAQAIITEHKGTIEVDSTEGKGTSFVIILPIDFPEDLSDPSYDTDRR